MLKALDTEFRETEKWRLALNRRLAEVCGDALTIKEEQRTCDTCVAKIDRRLAALEAKQQSLADSTKRALQTAVTMQRRQDEADLFEACMQGLSRRGSLAERSPSNASEIKGPVLAVPEDVLETQDLLQMLDQEQQPEPEGEALPQADFAPPTRQPFNPEPHSSSTARLQGAASPEADRSMPLGWDSDVPQLWPTKRWSRGQGNTPVTPVREAEQLPPPQRHAHLEDAAGELRTQARDMQAVIQQQTLELDRLSIQLQGQEEQLSGFYQRIVELAPMSRQTSPNEASISNGDAAGLPRASQVKFALAAAEVRKLQGHVERQTQQLERLQAQLMDMRSEPACSSVITSKAPPCSTSGTCVGASADKPAPPLQEVVGRGGESLAIGLLEVQRRCDSMQDLIDVHIIAALDQVRGRLPEVERCVEQLGTSCQEWISRGKDQELKANVLRAEHEASNQRIALLSNQVERFFHQAARSPDNANRSLSSLSS